MGIFFKRMSSARVIALGFLSVILIGSILLSLPFSVRDGVELSYIDALYTSTSAVCVTGLVVVDTADTFTPIGQFIVGLLIQIGGLGVASIGAGVILAVGHKVDLKGRNLVRDAMNLDAGKGIITFLRNVFFTTLAIELVGAILSFFVFVQDYSPLHAVGISLFHSVASFNNAGFDILGGFTSLTPYRDNVYLNIVTCVLVILGGIGFLVMKEVVQKRFRWKKLSMHAKVVLSTSAALLLGGTILLRLSEDISWLTAFFNSVSARTAGFSTVPLGTFSGAGLLLMIILMVIGASPGSTGGGIKTTTFFVLLSGIKSAATNKSEKAFKYSLPADAFKKACIILLMALLIILTSTYLILVMEPELSFIDALFEMASAFGTVGLSTGITTNLSTGSKILSMLIMFIGRLGPLTIATLWYFSNGERITYPEGKISIG